MRPATPGAPPPPPVSQYGPNLVTVPGPQLTTRYGPQPTTPAAGATLSTIQGPQLTTRYRLPGYTPSPTSALPGTPTGGPGLPRTTSYGGPTSFTPGASSPLPRTTSQTTFYPHVSTSAAVSSPLAMPSAPTPTAAPSMGGLMLPSTGVAPGQASSVAGPGQGPAVGVAAGTRGGGRKPMSLRGAFTKELHALMYACGDDANPASDTINVMEEILIEYIEHLAQEAIRGQPKSRLTVDGLRRALGRPEDKEKLGRLNDLVYRDSLIAAARRSWKDPY